MAVPMSPADHPARRAARYVLRVPLLVWHVLIHLPLTVLLINPLTARLRLPGGESVAHRVIRCWQGGLMRVFGMRVRRVGTPVAGAGLFVANHVCWIDIVAMHSQRVVGFVAKREIQRWPLIGWLASRGETIYHQRGSQQSLGEVTGAMVARLRAGRSVGVFPEGRTRDGREIGPFHARIFMAAVEVGVPVQPVALRYGPRGAAQARIAFAPRESFFGNFLRLLGEPGCSADIVFLPPIAPDDARARRDIAQTARARIIEAMTQE